VTWWRRGAAQATTVTLRLARCPGCVVAVYNTARASNGLLRLVSITRGVGRFTVRSLATRGMSFGMSGTGPYTAPDYRPDIAVAVARSARVSAAKARRASAAARCWSGTSARRFTIHVRLVTFQSRDFSNKVVTVAAFWASSNLPGFSLVHLSRHQGEPNVAGIGDQDPPFCR
jgi:hypothetical protein